MSWRAVAAAALAALTLALTAPAFAKPPLWIVRSPHATLVLFGSIHLLPPGLDWRPAALDDALAKADEIWLELPLDTAADNDAERVVHARGALKPGQSLSALLGPDYAARLTDATAALKYPVAPLERMQPWLAELTLSMVQDARSGASSLDGVEAQVQAIAPRTARRRAFETAPQQIEFLAGAPRTDQIASLELTIDEIVRDPSIYQRIVGEWMAGDLAALDRNALAEQRTAVPAAYDRLVTQRNRRWARILSQRLREPGQLVVVVGIGHLIGPGGLPALLRARGLDVAGP